MTQPWWDNGGDPAADGVEGMSTPTVGSLFSGIGGFDLGLERAGWIVQWQVENDKFRNRILKRHWPKVKRYGDITAVDAGQLERVGLICGGFPCQDLSVAGKREGLAGERSALFFEFARIADALRPSWVLVENVPGLFSSNAGRDFLMVINTLADIGYGLAWRVLDSRYFGVPQRRRRVYIVGCLGRPCPPEVLFESESLSGHTTPSKEAWETAADTIGTSADRTSGRQGGLAPVLADTITSAYAKHHGSSGGKDNTIRNYVKLTIGGDSAYLGVGGSGEAYVGAPTDPNGVREATGVPRRLDSPRYAALGDAVTVPVIEWLGRRILKAHKEL